MDWNVNTVVTYNDVEDAIAELDSLRDRLSKIKDDTDTDSESTSTKENEVDEDISSLYEQYGVQYIANKILDIAKLFTPVKTGRLRDSGRVEVDEATNTARVIFGEGLDYAVFVHEILENIHLNGRAKFLEDAAYSVISYSQVDSEPLFTFEMILDGNLVICSINSIDTESFMNNEKQREALYNITLDDLTTEDLGGETID